MHPWMPSYSDLGSHGHCFADVVMVGDVASLRGVVPAVRSHGMVAVDCEGVNLSRFTASVFLFACLHVFLEETGGRKGRKLIGLGATSQLP